MKHLLVLAILVGTARAETRVSVRWGNVAEAREAALVRLHGVEDATVDHVGINVHSDAANVYATLTFRISTKRRDAREIHVPIELRAGTAVTAMSYSVGGEPQIEALAHEADYAREVFESIVRSQRDPALLRLAEHSSNRDVLDFAVFPVTRGMPASVTIEMTLPRTTRLVLDPGPHHKQRAFELPTPTEPATARARSVDGTTSLFAGDIPFGPPVVKYRQRVMPTVTYSDRRFELRKQIRAHASELGHCYELGVLLEPTLSSSMQIAIDIAARGTVENVAVEELGNDDVRRCVIDEVSSWLFSQTDHGRQVRQEIDLAHLD
jgi:hypothetical protein